jgi:hypothetical protein
LGHTLHKFKGLLAVERNKIILKGINSDFKEFYRFVFSPREIENVYLGLDEILRLWKDARALIRP